MVLEQSGKEASQRSGGWCREVAAAQELPALFLPSSRAWLESHLWVPLEASSWAWQLVASSSSHPNNP